jgi:hypothetical protein
MPNSQMQGKTYAVPANLRNFLGNALTYENLKRIKSEMNSFKKEKNLAEFNKKGGDASLKWIDETLKMDRNSIKGVKEIGMDTGRENMFQKPGGEKNKYKNASVVINPKVNLKNLYTSFKPGRGSATNVSTEQQIKKMLYLIEYITNVKKK